MALPFQALFSLYYGFGAFFIGLGAGALGWIGGDYWERFWRFFDWNRFAASGLLVRRPRPGAGY